MYPVPSPWPNRLWSIGAAVLAAWVLLHMVLLALEIKDELWRSVVGNVARLIVATWLFVLCVDRTTWSPAWLTAFLDRRLRRRPAPAVRRDPTQRR